MDKSTFVEASVTGDERDGARQGKKKRRLDHKAESHCAKTLSHPSTKRAMVVPCSAIIPRKKREALTQHTAT